jgi:hypothetical protein
VWLVDALAISRTFLHVACHGQELGAHLYHISKMLYDYDVVPVDEFLKLNFLLLLLLLLLLCPMLLRGIFT